MTTLVNLTFLGNVFLHRENIANLPPQVGSICSECYLPSNDLGLRSSYFSRKFKNFVHLMTSLLDWVTAFNHNRKNV